MTHPNQPSTTRETCSTLAAAACAGWLLAMSAAAGTTDIADTTAPVVDWCDWVGTMQARHRNEAHPILREFRLEGRYQYQAGHVDGRDVNGDAFHETHDEHRRLRFGARAKFAGNLSAQAVVNLVDDQRFNGGSLDWGYDSFDLALVSLDVGGLIGGGPFDTLEIRYGRHKYELSQEARMSSNRILTFERSAISNKVYASARPTGLSINATAGDWSWSLGLFSAGRDGGDNGFLGGFHGDMIYLSHISRQFTEQLVLAVDAVYNDTTFGADAILPYRWAISLNADYNTGPWGIVGDLIAGDNGGAGNGAARPERQGGFHGIVMMPYFWIIEDRLQAVVQYQFGGSSASEGVRANSRYGRAATNAPAALNGGRGDRHHSLYAGLNHYFCGHNAKIMAGVEYQTMRTGTGTRGDFNTLSWLIGMRGHF